MILRRVMAAAMYLHIRENIWRFMTASWNRIYFKSEIKKKFTLLLAIVISAFLEPSLQHAQMAMVISWWPWYTRIMRGEAISIKERQYIKAADTIGTPRVVSIFKHIIPNGLSPIIIQASQDMGAVVLTVASLGFLGLGAQPPTPEWGLMVSTSKSYFMNAWWYTVFPGAAIFITVLIFNVIGDGLREVLDPKTRKI